MSKIEISNYKKIETVEIDISFGHVNYIFGTNSSGKSSVLESIFLEGRGYKNDQIISSEMYFSRGEYSSTLVTGIEKENKKYFYFPSKEKFTSATILNETVSSYFNIMFCEGVVLRSYKDVFNLLYFPESNGLMIDKIGREFERFYKKIINKFTTLGHLFPEEYIRYENKIIIQGEEYHENTIADGINSLKDLVYWFFALCRLNQSSECIFLIDEIDLNLDPQIHEILPTILDKFTSLSRGLTDHGCTFIVTSHSQPLAYSLSKNEKFEVDHIVNKMRNGKLQNLEMTESLRREVAKCLGFSVNYLLNPMKEVSFGEKPIIIVCEGENGKKTGLEDAVFYNSLNLYKILNRPIMFISNRGKDTVEEMFKRLLEIATDYKNIDIFFLKDRDQRNVDERVSGEIILSRRFLESYAYSSETLNLMSPYITENELIVHQELCDNANTNFENDKDSKLKNQIVTSWKCLTAKYKISNLDIKSIAEIHTFNSSETFCEIADEICSQIGQSPTFLPKVK